MCELATRVTEVENCPVDASALPLIPFSMSGYRGIPPLPATGPVILEDFTTLPAVTQPVVPSLPVPITQIPFLHSPSPVPSFLSMVHIPHPLSSAAMHMPPLFPNDPPDLADVGVRTTLPQAFIPSLRWKR
jgi:hypothetical protein